MQNGKICKATNQTSNNEEMKIESLSNENLTDEVKKCISDEKVMSIQKIDDCYEEHQTNKNDAINKKGDNETAETKSIQEDKPNENFATKEQKMKENNQMRNSNDSFVTNDNIKEKEEIAVSQIKSRRSRVIISNDQPMIGLISQMLKEMGKFNKDNLNFDKTDLTPFEFRVTSSSNVLREIKNFLKRRVPLRATSMMVSEDIYLVFGDAILKSKTSIKNSFEFSMNKEVIILNMLALDCSPTKNTELRNQEEGK